MFIPIELELQVLNLKHNLEMLGKALDEKDKLIMGLCIRCSNLTKMKECHCCEFKRTCDTIRRLGYEL